MPRFSVRNMRQAESYAAYMRFRSLFKRSTALQPEARFWDALCEAMTADVADVELLREWARM